MDIGEMIRSPKDITRLLRPMRYERIGNSLESDESLGESVLRRYQSDSPTVPRGFLAVYVGPENRRFVIPASYLSMPDFRVLMEKVAEEFGFEQQGALKIPCEEEDFEKILLRCFERQEKMKNKK
ncbi:PREDICTED: auxin-induced protein X15-like [Nelumbo nucifera]|nr:PREDICTED: auxin-induced protein X15-like [Nelumbo nucifera]